MITELQLESFKCFGQRTTIPFAPITLIYGENSSGKTSILQSLYLLKQTIEFAPPSTPLLTNWDAGYVQLGSLRDIITGRKQNGGCGIGMRAHIKYEDKPDEISAFFCWFKDCGGKTIIDSLDQHGTHEALDMSDDMRKIQKARCTQEIPHCVRAKSGKAGRLEYPAGPLPTERRYALHRASRDIMVAGARKLIALDALNKCVQLGRAQRLFNLTVDGIAAIVIRKVDQQYVVRQGEDDMRIICLDDTPTPNSDPLRAKLDQLGPFLWPGSRKFVCARDPYQDASRMGYDSVDETDEEMEWADGSVTNDFDEDVIAIELIELMLSETYQETVRRAQSHLLQAIEFYSNEFTEEMYEARQEDERNQARHCWTPWHWLAVGTSTVEPALDDLIYKAGTGFLLFVPCLGANGQWQVHTTSGTPDTSKEVPPLHADCNAVIEALRDMVCIGPLRAQSARYYDISALRASRVGFSGSEAIDLLAANPDLLRKLAVWANALGVDYDFDIQCIGGDLCNVAALALRDRRKKGSPWTTLKDVGVGVAQVLPVITCLLAYSNRTITIEQPELHLHPKLQAELADLVARSVTENRNQVLLETHSEHMVLRIQRLIRRQTLYARDVAVLYVSRDERGATVKQLRLDPDGDFVDPWPGGFFAERLEEILGE